MKHLRKAARCIFFTLAVLSLTACGAKYRELKVSPPAGDWEVEVSDLGIKYLYSKSTGEKILCVYVYDKLGNLTEISLEDCAGIKNQTPVISDDLMCSKDELESKAPKISSKGSYRFEAEEAFTALGAGEKVSADYKGTVMLTAQPEAVMGYVVGSVSSSTAAVNGAVAADAGFTWNSYLPVLLGDGFSAEIPEGVTAYLLFEPYLNVAQGRVRGNGASAWCASPVATASGGADGLLEIVIR